MLDTIFGLPVHALVVHAPVGVVPSAALAVALAAAWPRFRRWAGFLPLLLSLGGLVLVPVSTSSGASLERRVPPSALVERHTQLGEGLLVWVIVLTVAAAGLYALRWQESRTAVPSTRRQTNRTVLAATGLVLALSLVGVAGTVVQVVRIGHSGAQAAWSDVATTTMAPTPTPAPRPLGPTG